MFRPYYAAPTNKINLSEYKKIYSIPITSFGIKFKEFSVAEKIRKN
jgi:hypothetical protein